MHEALSEPSTLRIYLVAAKQKAEIRKSLRQEGFMLEDELAKSSHLLRVTLGVDTGFDSCGTLNNVKYSLRNQGRPLIEIQGRGWTRKCDPNIFDQMSQSLAISLEVKDFPPSEGEKNDTP